MGLVSLATECIRSLHAGWGEERGGWDASGTGAAKLAFSIIRTIFFSRPETATYDKAATELPWCSAVGLVPSRRYARVLLLLVGARRDAAGMLPARGQPSLHFQLFLRFFSR